MHNESQFRGLHGDHSRHKHPDYGTRAYYKTISNESATVGCVPTRLMGLDRQNDFAELCTGFEIFVRSRRFF